MKVLFVASRNKTGKPGTVVKNQAVSLCRSGIEIDFFLVNGTGVKGYLRNIKPLFKHLKNNHYDIIHSHYSLSAFVTTISLCFSKETHHIVSLMGSDTRAKGILKLFINYFSSKFWDKTIVKSRSMLYDTKLTHVEVLPNGVDILKVKEIEREFSNKKKDLIKGQKNVILFAANPDNDVKNFLLAQRAAEFANQEVNVIYDISHEEILKEILKARIVLLTSKWEGSPNIVKEAMACNCPVVATDVGDIRWLFGNEPGHFITSFEPEDVAEKIKQALEFSEKHGGTNGRQRILELELDSETIAKRIITVYEEVIG